MQNNRPSDTTQYYFERATVIPNKTKNCAMQLVYNPLKKSLYSVWGGAIYKQGVYKTNSKRTGNKSSLTLYEWKKNIIRIQLR